VFENIFKKLNQCPRTFSVCEHNSMQHFVIETFFKPGTFFIVFCVHSLWKQYDQKMSSKFFYSLSAPPPSTWKRLLNLSKIILHNKKFLKNSFFLTVVYVNTVSLCRLSVKAPWCCEACHPT